MFDLQLLSSLIFDKMDNQQKVRENLIKIYNEFPSRSYQTIARQAGVSRNTVSRVIKNYKDLLTINRKPGSGRKKGFVHNNKADKVRSIFARNPNTSGRKVAKKTNCSESFVRKLKKEIGLKTYKVQKVPDRNSKKNLVAKGFAK